MPSPKTDEGYVRLFDHFYHGKHITRKVDTHIDTKKPPRIFFDGDEIVKLIVSQSLIKKLLFKGEELPNLCPHKILHCELLRDIVVKPTLSMLYGLYFEEKFLGKSAYERGIELPKSVRTGAKLVAEQRIDEAVLRAKRVAVNHGMVISPNYVQVKRSQQWMPKDTKKFTWFQIYVDGIADIITPFEYEKIRYDACVVDVKLSADKDLCYVDKYEPWKTFPWGCPGEMDHIQAKMYDELFHLPFVYMVFDYKATNAGYKIIPVITKHGYPDDKIAIERQRELHRDIDFAVTKIVMWNEEKWPKEPSDACLKCPVLNCEHQNKHKPV